MTKGRGIRGRFEGLFCFVRSNQNEGARPNYQSPKQRKVDEGNPIHPFCEIRRQAWRVIPSNNLPQFGAAHSPYSSSRGRCCQEVSKRGDAFAEQGRPVGHPIFGSMLRYAKGALSQRKKRDRLRNAVPRVLRRQVLTRNFLFFPSQRCRQTFLLLLPVKQLL